MKIKDILKEFDKNFWQDKDENDKISGWLAMKTQVFKGQQMCKIANPDDIKNWLKETLKQNHQEDIHDIIVKEFYKLEEIPKDFKLNQEIIRTRNAINKAIDNYLEEGR